VHAIVSQKSRRLFVQQGPHASMRPSSEKAFQSFRFSLSKKVCLVGREVVYHHQRRVIYSSIMSKENAEPDFWDVLSPDQKQHYLLLLGAFSTILFVCIGLKGIAVLMLLARVFSDRKPSRTTFISFFERWFKEQLFPRLSDKLKEELVERSRRRNSSIFKSLKDTANAFIVGHTVGLQAELSWISFSKRLSPAFRDFYAFRAASVNMGTPENPSFVVFIGFNNEWYLSPHIQLNFDDISVLGMME